MNTQLETLISEARDGYLHSFSEEVVDVDRIIEYLNDPESNWLPADIVRHWPQITDRFLSDHNNASGLELARELLTSGTADGTRMDVAHMYFKRGAWEFDEPPQSRGLGDGVETYRRRLFFAHLALQAPFELEAIKAHDIFALHGTKGVVLPDIIAQQSLLSHRIQHRLGILSGSAEEHPVAMRRDFVSFANINEDIASSYATTDRRRPEQLETLSKHGHLYEGWKLRFDEIQAYIVHLQEQIASGNEFLKKADETRFGVMIGLSQPALWMAGIDPKIGHRVEVQSSTPEFGFAHQVSTEYLPVMAVPDDHRADVENLLSESSYQPVLISSDALSQAREAVRYAQR